MTKRICICGKVFDGETMWCSDRCQFIVNQLATPGGRVMSLDRAVRFFGKRWDEGHKDD